MSRSTAVKWGVGVVLVAAGVGGAFVGGVRVGAAGSAAMSNAVLTQVQAVSAERAVGQLELLDAGSAQALRERIEVELEGELAGLCGIGSPGGAGPRHDVRIQAVLKRVARYRAEHPAALPASWLSEPAAQEAHRRVERCLEAARGGRS